MRNRIVIDHKPKNKIVLDPKPKMRSGIITEVDRLYTQVLTTGMYMGIPPHTYPETGTVLSSFSP